MQSPSNPLRLVMCNRNLNFRQKALYGYLNSVSCDGTGLLPHISTICEDLGIDQTLCKNDLLELIKSGFLKIDSDTNNTATNFQGVRFTLNRE